MMSGIPHPSIHRSQFFLKFAGEKLISMDNKQTRIEELFDELKDYGNVRLELLRLKAIRKISSTSSELIVLIILIAISSLVLFCITIALALLLGAWAGKMYLGFFIMAGVFIVIGLILYSGRNKFVKTSVSDKIVKELLDLTQDAKFSEDE